MTIQHLTWFVKGPVPFILPLFHRVQEGFWTTQGTLCPAGYIKDSAFWTPHGTFLFHRATDPLWYLCPVPLMENLLHRVSEVSVALSGFSINQIPWGVQDSERPMREKVAIRGMGQFKDFVEQKYPNGSMMGRKPFMDPVEQGYQEGFVGDSWTTGFGTHHRSSRVCQELVRSPWGHVGWLPTCPNNLLKCNYDNFSRGRFFQFQLWYFAVLLHVHTLNFQNNHWLKLYKKLL